MSANGGRRGPTGWWVPALLVVASLGENGVAAATVTPTDSDAVAPVPVDATADDATAETTSAAASATMTGTEATRAPAWSALYARYMASGTVGDCGSCHVEAQSPASTYDWLAAQQYMTGSSPYLVDPRTSVFSWLGGDMPPDGPNRYVRATKELTAWASAGAKND